MLCELHVNSWRLYGVVRGRVEHPRDKRLTFNCLPSSPVTSWSSVELCCLQLGKLATAQPQWHVCFVFLGLRLNSLLSRVYLCLLWVPVLFSAAVVYRTAAPSGSSTTRRQRRRGRRIGLNEATEAALQRISERGAADIKAVFKGAYADRPSRTRIWDWYQCTASVR